MRQLPPLDSLDEAILSWIARLKRPTAAMLHELALPQVGKSSLYERLAHLSRLSLIAARPLRGRQRYYTLRTRGARLLGLTKLPGANWRSVDYQFHLASHLGVQIDLMAKRKGWMIAHSDEDGAQMIAGFLAEIAASERGDAFEPHLFASLIPDTLLPDRVISTKREVLIAIIAHPHSEGAFWSRRLRRYRGIIHELRFVFVALTPQQRLDWYHALVRNESLTLTRLELPIPKQSDCETSAKPPVAIGNFLMLLPGHLASLPTFLS